MTFAPKGGYKQPQQVSPKLDNIKSQRSPGLQSKDLPDLSRPVQKTSFYYFKLYSVAWHWALVSLAFDFCILLFLPLVQPALFGEPVSFTVEIVCVALLAIAASWFFRNWSLALLTSWHSSREKIFKVIERNPVLVLALLAVIVALEVFLKVGQVGILSSILTIVIFLGTLKPMREGIKERIQKDKNIAQDLTAQIETFNFRMFLLHFIPLSAARLTILISAIAFPLSIQLSPNFLVSLSIGCVMLSLMQAEEQHFMIVCPRCGTKTSRFLAPYKSCLACLAAK